MGAAAGDRLSGKILIVPGLVASTSFPLTSTQKQRGAGLDGNSGPPMPDELQHLLHRIAFADVWATVSMDANSIMLKHRRKLSAKLLPLLPGCTLPVSPVLFPAESAADGPASLRMTRGCVLLGATIWLANFPS